MALVSADDDRARVRQQAFADAAHRLGAHEVKAAVVPAPSTLSRGRAGLPQLLGQRSKFDAVFCSSDMLALGVLTEASARGIRVPAQLAVMGFGDLAFAADTFPALTTVRVDGVAIGRQAAQFIIERAVGRAPAVRIIDLGFSIVARSSA